MRYRVEPRTMNSDDAKVIDATSGRIVARFVDWQDADEFVRRKNADPITEAEKVLRPYLNTGAIWGITPSHKFREREMLPVYIRDDIAKALRYE